MALTPCAPCECIPGNILNDKFKQDIEIILCGILEAVGTTTVGLQLADFYFGNGALGDRTISMPFETISVDAVYDNLTIDAGSVLRMSPTTSNTAPVFVIKDTLVVNGVLSGNGRPGGNAIGVSTGGNAGFSQMGPFGSQATAGADSGGVQALPVLPIAGVNGGSNGISGAGGSGGLGAGGAAGAATIADGQGPHQLTVTPGNLTPAYADTSVAGRGGSSGKGDGINTAGGGGGGGGAATNIYIFAKNIFVGASGIITSRGGNGGNGGTPVVGNTGGGGGGSGAGGGFIYLVYKNLINNGLIAAVAGSGGSAGTGSGTGTNGTAGAPGTAGQILKLNLTTGTFDP